MRDDVLCVSGGVFEEAIAIANLMLQGGQEIAQTVRTATFVDNTWKVIFVPHVNLMFHVAINASDGAEHVCSSFKTGPQLHALSD